MSRPAKSVFDMMIARRVADDELRTARALGAGWFEAYVASYRCMDEVLALAWAPMPAMVLTRFRPIKRI